LADGEVDDHPSRDRRPPQEARQTQWPAGVQDEDHPDADEARERLVAETAPPPQNDQRQETETGQVADNTPGQVWMPTGDVQAAGHGEGHGGGDQFGSVETNTVSWSRSSGGHLGYRPTTARSASRISVTDG
jgi:hypothetical protein